MKKLLLAAVLVGPALVVGPERTGTINVPFPAGASTDMVARNVAAE